MANWKIKIDVSDIWDRYDEDNFEEIQSEICDRLSADIDEVNDKLGEYEAMKFEDLIQNLRDVEDIEEFDYVWQDFYDWADANLVWLGTF